MSAPRRLIRFGHFELDRDDGSLRRDGRPFDLTPLQTALLTVFLERPGQIVSRSALIDLAWNSREITEDALNKAIDRVRAALKTDSDPVVQIVAVRSRGFRLDGPVEEVTKPASTPAPPAPFDVRALLADQMTVVTQRSALETLNATQVAAARTAFEAMLARDPQSVPALTGLANALVLAFEATRAETMPNHTLLQEAERHAVAACQLAPASPEPWGVLATVYHRLHLPLDAIAAARKAVELEPGGGLIHNRLRLAFVSGGSERLRAAEHVIDRAPGNGLAHWLAATVYAARGVLHRAHDHALLGCEVQDRQRGLPRSGGALTVVGLHLLRGMVLHARGETMAARAAYDCELSFDASGHIFDREARANTHYALGALDLNDGAPDRARAQFEQAVVNVPGHGPSTTALSFLAGHPPSGPGGSGGTAVLGNGHDPVADAISQAIALVLHGRQAEAAHLMLNALELSTIGGPGAAWILPVEPILYRSMSLPEWTATRARLVQLAS